MNRSDTDPRFMAHAVHVPDRPPVADSAIRDWTIVLFAIATLLLIAGLAVLQAKGYLR